MMVRKVRSGTFLVMILLWSGIAAAQPSGPIKIGWVGALTGFLSSWGHNMLRGAQMAVNEVNAGGGVLGRKLELVVRDDHGNPSQAVTLARQLDKQDHVLVLSGSLSADVAMALRGYAEANHVPYISPNSGESALTSPGTKWTFRVQAPAPVQGAAMTKFVLSLKPNARIAVVRHDILYYPELMNGAIWYMEKSHKGKLVYNKYFPPRQSDFNVAAAQLKAAHPDFIVFAFNPPGLENFIRSVLAVGFKANQLISFPIPPMTQRAVGKDIVGIYGATFFEKSLRKAFPKAGTLSDRFFAKYGHYPSQIATNPYGTVKMIAQAIKASGTVNRTAFVKALRSAELVDPLGQKFHFDKNGQSSLNSVYIIQAVKFSDRRLATFAFRDTIRFGPKEVPDLKLAKVRK